MFWVCDDMSGWMDNVSVGEVQMDVGEVRVNVGLVQMNVAGRQMVAGEVPMSRRLLRGRVGVLHMVVVEVSA